MKRREEVRAGGGSTEVEESKEKGVNSKERGEAGEEKGEENNGKREGKIRRKGRTEKENE